MAEELKNHWFNFTKHVLIFWSWLNLIINRQPLKISQDPTLFFNNTIKSIPAKIVWQATGVYKIVIEPAQYIIPGKINHINVPITDKKIIWTIIFYGLNKVETKYLTLCGQELILNTETFPERIPIGTASFNLTEEKILAFSRIKTQQIMILNKMPLLKLSVPKVETHWLNFKLPLPQLKFPKYK